MDKGWTNVGQNLDICPKFVKILSNHTFYRSTRDRLRDKSVTGTLLAKCRAGRRRGSGFTLLGQDAVAFPEDITGKERRRKKRDRYASLERIPHPTVSSRGENARQAGGTEENEHNVFTLGAALARAYDALSLVSPSSAKSE